MQMDFFQLFPLVDLEMQYRAFQLPGFLLVYLMVAASIGVPGSIVDYGANPNEKRIVNLLWAVFYSLLMTIFALIMQWETIKPQEWFQLADFGGAHRIAGYWGIIALIVGAVMVIISYAGAQMIKSYLYGRARGAVYILCGVVLAVLGLHGVIVIILAYAIMLIFKIKA